MILLDQKKKANDIHWFKRLFYGIKIDVITTIQPDFKTVTSRKEIMDMFYIDVKY